MAERDGHAADGGRESVAVDIERNCGVGCRHAGYAPGGLSVSEAPLGGRFQMGLRKTGPRLPTTPPSITGGLSGIRRSIAGR
jgi:hypothetical protein